MMIDPDDHGYSEGILIEEARAATVFAIVWALFIIAILIGAACYAWREIVN